MVERARGAGGEAAAAPTSYGFPSKKPLMASLARSFWLLYCCYRLSIEALAAPRPVALSLRVEQLLHVEQRLPRNGASPVRHLRPANLKALCGMWAGELLLPRLPEARVEAPQEGLPAACRHGHE